MIHAIHLITGRFCGAMRVVALVLAGAATLLAASPAAAQDRSPASCDLPPPRPNAQGLQAPAMIGMGTAEVLRALPELLRDGIIPHSVLVRSSAPRGQVVDQWPKPGQIIVGGVFRLCASDGRDAPQRLMPNLVGQRLETAQQALTGLGIEARPTVRRADRQEPPGVIYAQSPRSGTRLRASTRITLDVSNGPPIVMPNLLGQQLEGARRALAGIGIQASPNVRQAERPEPRGVVFGQSPAAGTRVNAATAIVLEVSTGPPILMPALVGRPLDQGRQMLRGLGIQVAPNVRQAEHREPRGVVFGQSPAAGTRVNAATAIVLEVSTGPPILMPELVGRPLDQGRQMLRGLGIRVAPTVRQAEHSEPAGVIYGQSPAAGARMNAATHILLDVSSGPPILMPDLVGRPLDQGRRALLSLGIGGNAEIRRARHRETLNAIYGQSPAAGARVTAATAIVLDVSDGEIEPAVVPDVVGHSEGEAVALLRDAGLVAVPDAAEASEIFAQGQVVRSIPPADERVQPGSPVHYVLSATQPPENPILRWLKDNLVVLLVLVGGILIGAAAMAVMPSRPSFSVELVGPPRAKADWGQPPDLAFEVRFDPPRASLHMPAAEPDEEGA